MSDAIADLGYCAATCELEAHLCPWERVELRERAAAYRAEQLRLLAGLTQLLEATEAGIRGERTPTKPGHPVRQRRGRRRVFA